MSERPRRASSRERRPRHNDGQGAPSGTHGGSDRGQGVPLRPPGRDNPMQAAGGYASSSRSYEEGRLGSSSGRGPSGDVGLGRGGSYTAPPGWQARSGGGNSGQPGQGSGGGAREHGPGGGPSGGGGALGPGGYGFGDYGRSSGARAYDGGRDQEGREQERHNGRRDAPGGYGERAPGGGAGPDRAGYGYGGDRDSGRDRGGDRERGRGEPYGGGRDRGREQPYGERRDRREHEGGRGTDSSRGSYAGGAPGGGYGGPAAAYPGGGYPGPGYAAGSAAGGSRGYQGPGGGPMHGGPGGSGLHGGGSYGHVMGHVSGGGGDRGGPSGPFSGGGGGGFRGGDRGGPGSPFSGGGGGGFRGGDRGGPGDPFSGGGGGGFRGGDRGGFGGGGGRGYGGGGRGGYGGGSSSGQAADAYMQGHLALVEPARRVPVPQAEEVAVRPDQGCTLGRTTAVLANYFLLQVDAAKLPRVKMYNLVIVQTDEKEAQERQRQLAEAGASIGGAATGDATSDPLPLQLTRELVDALARQESWVTGTWAYDGQHDLFTPAHVDLGIGSAGKVYTVSIQGAGPRPKLFRVTVRPVADIHMGELLRLVGAQGRGLAARELPAGQAMVDAVRALDVVLKEVLLSEDGVTAVGRGFFSAEKFGRPTHVTGCLELWPGFTQTLHACASGLALLVAPLVVAFVSPKLGPEALAQVLGLRDVYELGREWGDTRLAEKAVNNANKFLRGYKICFTGPKGRDVTKRIFCVTAQTAAGIKFDYTNEDDGTTENISVARYFERTGRKLRHPEWPCLDLGRKDKPLAVPIEMCRIVEGQRKGTLDAEQTTAMLQQAKKDPRELVAAVRGRAASIAALLAGQGGNAAGAHWGVSMEGAQPEMLRAEAHVLPAPRLEYGDGRRGTQAVDVGDSGSWNVRGLQYVKGARVRRWCVVCLVDEGAQQVQEIGGVEALKAQLYDFMGRVGMEVDIRPQDSRMVVVFQERHHNAQRPVRELLYEAVQRTRRLQGDEPDLIVALLPDKGKANYDEVKGVCDTELGIMSQCMALSNLTRKRQKGPGRGRGGGGGGGVDPGTIANLLHKVNGKLGGVNWGLYGGTKYLPVLGGDDAPPFMVMGCDVTHPEGGVRAFRDVDAPASVAAVVAARDMALGNGWSTRFHVQDGRQEVMSCTNTVVGMFKELIEEYANVAKEVAGPNAPLVDHSLPVPQPDHYASKALWSQGKFRYLPARIIMYRDGVSDGEFNHVIRAEVKAIKKLTFAVVKKKHGTRLVAADPRDSDGKGNLRPGTVVDRAVVSTAGFDFFLNSHQGLQGTNRAARYVVLVDEIGFGSNGIQLLTYWMCYTYQRATKSVSLPPPAYYAHLAAFRYRRLLSFHAARGAQDIHNIINQNLVNKPFYL